MRALMERETQGDTRRAAPRSGHWSRVAARFGGALRASGIEQDDHVAVICGDRQELPEIRRRGENVVLLWGDHQQAGGDRPADET